MVERYAGGLVTASVSGAGPAVWVLHSLLADAGSCLPFAAALAGERRVVVPDLPGFGGSTRADGGIEAVAARIADAMAEEAAPVVLVGNGYGSFVALLAALRRPELVQRLVLAGTGAGFDAAGQAAFRGMAGAAGAKGLAAIADTAMLRLFPAPFQAAHPDLVAARRAAFLATDAGVFVQACADLAALDLRAQLGRVQVPVLALAGEMDAATPAWMARELAGLVPDGRFVALPGLAHVPQLQDTAAFVAATREFV